MLLFGINSCSKQTGCLVIVIFDTSIQNIGNAYQFPLNCFCVFQFGKFALYCRVQVMTDCADACIYYSFANIS